MSIPLRGKTASTSKTGGYTPLAGRTATVDPQEPGKRYTPLSMRGIVQGAQEAAEGFRSYVPIIARQAEQGAKKFVAEGIPGATSGKPAPKTWKEALQTGGKNRAQMVADAFQFDPENPMESKLAETVGGFAGATAPVRAVAPKVFEGFKDITTKLLEKMKGKSATSRQEIFDFTNQPDLKQPEKDLFRRLLEDEGDQVDVPTFANRVKSELLPLKRAFELDSNSGAQYENITLPDELRGPVANYKEHLYESPIKTSAGGTHFNEEEIPNYFAHTRIEDLPDGSRVRFDDFQPGDVPKPEGKGFHMTRGGTRRVIEIQSDLFQKGRLEGERTASFEVGDPVTMPDGRQATIIEAVENRASGEVRYDDGTTGPVWWDQLEGQFKQRDLSKLEPYRNTWWERIVREEVKQAAKDGKTKLQFPTGETAAKIEGHVGMTEEGVPSFWRVDEAGRMTDTPAHPSSVSPGDVIASEMTGQNWRIVVGNDGTGRVLALPEARFQQVLKEEFGGDMNRLKADMELKEYDWDEIDSEFYIDSTEILPMGMRAEDSPVYGFYEKTLGRYLAKKYGAKVVTDPQGVKWYEMEVKPEYGTSPVEAFGALGIPFGLGSMDKEQQGKWEGIEGTQFEEKKRTPLDIVTGKSEIRRKPGGTTDLLLEAIGENETSIIPQEKRYSYAKDSGSKTLGRDLGKYQVTEGELKSFGKQFLGREVNAEEFLGDPQLQEQYMRAKVAFLEAEGLTPEEIVAVHAQGMTGWGDKKKLAQKIADANEHRSGYVTRAMERVNSRGPAADK